MQLSKIRGAQIKNGSITGLHIQDGQISKSHLHQSAIQAVLESKLVVDYVQLATPVSVDVASTSITVDITNKTAVQADDLASLGVLLGKKVIIRNATTGDVIYNPAEDHKHEVYGRLSFADDAYTLEFGCYEPDGTFTPYEMPEGTKLDIQYAQRFNLYSVDEMFAANEKFVDGAIDVTTALKIKELEAALADLEGKTGDGVDSLRSEFETKLEELKTELEEQIAEKEQALQTQIDELNEKIGTATTDEAEGTGIVRDIEEINEKIGTASTEDTEATGLVADIEALQEQIGTASSDGVDATGIIGDIEELQETVGTASTDIEDLKEKTDDIHYHRTLVVQIGEDFAGTTIDLPEKGFAKMSVAQDPGNMYECGVNVYVNGILQALNINYLEVESLTNAGYCAGIQFEEDCIIPGDIVLLEWEYKKSDIIPIQ